VIAGIIFKKNHPQGWLFLCPIAGARDTGLCESEASVNRRHFLTGGIALATQPNLYRAFGDLSGASSDRKSPQNLLARSYPEHLLAQRLLPINAWHPYPRCSLRAHWEAVPQDIRALLLQHGVAAQSVGWKVLTATSFLDYKRTGNRERYEKQEFGRRNQLSDLVIAECLEGKGRFLDNIADGVWLTCEESFWGAPAHLPVSGLPDITHPVVELFGAETGALLAWTSYLLGDQLEKISPQITARIRLETQQRLLKPARERTDFWWMGRDGEGTQLNNWNPWINSNLLVANLLLENDPRIRLQAIVKITKSLDAFLNQYSPDGGCEEGPGYWAVSAASYFEGVSFLQSATGNSSKILTNPFLDKMGKYIANIHIAKDYYVNFGDAHPHFTPPGDLIYRYGRAIGDEQFSAFGAYCANRTGLAATGPKLIKALAHGRPSLSRFLPALLGVTEIRDAQQKDWLVRDVWYPDLGLMAARENSDSTDGLYIAVQAASNGRSHAHNDSGSFILYANGEPVVIDIGVGTYTAKTFSSDRYSIWTMQSAYHNLPTVGGVMQHAGDAYRASQIAYQSYSTHSAVSFDLATAYPKKAGIKSWNRKLTLNRLQGGVLLEESFNLAYAAPVSLTIMTPGTPVVASKGRLLLRSIAERGPAVSLKYDDSQIQPVIEKISLTDPDLSRTWGSQIYRVLLNSKQPVSQGNWVFEFQR
jgi:hypothetical protein